MITLSPEGNEIVACSAQAAISISLCLINKGSKASSDAGIVLIQFAIFL